MNQELQKKCNNNNIRGIVNYINQNKLSYDSVLQYACYKGNMCVIKYILKFNENLNYNEAMFYACMSNNDTIIKLFLPKITNHNEIFKKLCYLGNLNIVQLIVNTHIDKININHGIIEASVYGYEEIIKLLIKCGANDINAFLRTLAKYGHTTLAKEMIRRSKRNDIYYTTGTGDILRNYAVLETCRFGHLETLNMFIEEKIMFDIERAKKLANEGHHNKILQLIQSLT